MFKPQELLSREVWTFVLSKLSTKDELSCRCVCVSFKKEVDSILSKNQHRLWLRHRDRDYAHYFCCDKDHSISPRDTLYFHKTISTKKLRFVSKLMPTLKILQLDPRNPLYEKNYESDGDFYYDVKLPDYRKNNGKAVPITKIFSQVSCLILPGGTEFGNFVGDLSQVKHLTLFDGIDYNSPTFPNLDSLEVRNPCFEYSLPMPCKRFVAPHATMEWTTLPQTMQVIETGLNCDNYISVGKPYFENLKILTISFGERYEQNKYLKTPIKFLKDHKESLTELSFSVQGEVANIKVLLPLLANLRKLSVKIATDKQAIEFKETKALAHNLQYFELCCVLWSATDENFGAILENLPTGLDNLSIEDVTSNGEINTVMEKIMEKVVNGDTGRVTFVGVGEYKATRIIDKMIKMKPSPVRVEQRNAKVFECHNYYSGRSQYMTSICDIVIFL